MPVLLYDAICLYYNYTHIHTHLLRIAYRIMKLECILRAKHSNSKPGRKQGRQEVKFHRWRFHCTHNKIMYIYWDLTHTHIHTPFWTHQISPSSRPSPSAPPPASAAQRPRRTARSDAASWPRPSGSVAEVRSIAQKPHAVWRSWEPGVKLNKWCNKWLFPNEK